MTRKRPVAISSGEDEDSQKVRKHPRKNTRQHSGGIAGRKRRDQDTDDDSASDTSSVDTSSDASADEEDVGDGADDLRELDAEGLASALAFEVFAFLLQRLDPIFIFLASPLGFSAPQCQGRCRWQCRAYHCFGTRCEAL